MSAVRQLPPPKSKGRWIERWAIDSDQMDQEYTISRDRDGMYGCSCPAWKFQKGEKRDCKHIEAFRQWNDGRTNMPKPNMTLNAELGDVQVLLAQFRGALDDGDFEQVATLRLKLEAHRGITEITTETIAAEFKRASEEIVRKAMAGME